MNEKEFNLAILKELRKIAGKVFAKVTVSKEGTYTAAELWNGKNSMGEKIEIFYMGTESDVYTAKVDTFEFQISAQDVFLRLWKFEQLCKVRQSDKARFTYGEAEHEIVNEKAMYYTGRMERGSYNHETGCCEITGDGNYKVVTRKVSLKKLSDKLAADKKERTYYKSGGVWYIISERPLPENITDRIKNEPDYLFGLLSKFDFSYKWELTAIYKTLYEAMKSERANSTPEQRKSENKPQNTVIVNTSAKEVRFVDGVLEHITDTGDYICFPESLLDDVLPKLIKAGRGVLTCDIIEDVPEDYPPEPYNKENPENVSRLATFKTRNVATSYERFQDRTICGRFHKNMCPNYLRQKVFPAESFQARREIRRFKPRCFAGYTNYHLWEGNALERKRNGNTSVYRALIRGETGISSG